MIKSYCFQLKFNHRWFEMTGIPYYRTIPASTFCLSRGFQYISLFVQKNREQIVLLFFPSKYKASALCEKPFRFVFKRLFANKLNIVWKIISSSICWMCRKMLVIKIGQDLGLYRVKAILQWFRILKISSIKITENSQTASNTISEK